MKDKEKTALVIIDMQNDFCPGGALEVKDGDKIVPLINKLTKSGKFDVIAATADWHPRNHVSFAANHSGKKVYDFIRVGDIEQILWPVHCVQGTKGAEFHKNLETDKFNIIIRKGGNQGIDSYSAFSENDKKTKTGLAGYLKSLDVKKVYVAGLALDYCVFYSAMDGSKDFDVYVIKDACRGVDFPEGNIEKSLNTMKENNIKIVFSKDILGL